MAVFGMYGGCLYVHNVLARLLDDGPGEGKLLQLIIIKSNNISPSIQLLVLLSDKLTFVV